MNNTGKIKVEICQGTACFVLGAASLLDAMENMPEQWNDLFDIVPVACLQYCNDSKQLGHMPFVRIDGVPFADMTPEKLLKQLEIIVTEHEIP